MYNAVAGQGGIGGHEKKRGIYSGLTAVIFWGLVPLYYIPIDHVSPLEILGHRIIWAAILLTLIMIVQKKIRLLIPKTSQIPKLFASSILIAINWLVFTFAVINENITQTALGYFINPLVSVFLGVIFLKESLDNKKDTKAIISKLTKLTPRNN